MTGTGVLGFRQGIHWKELEQQINLAIPLPLMKTEVKFISVHHSTMMEVLMRERYNLFNIAVPFLIGWLLELIQMAPVTIVILDCPSMWIKMAVHWPLEHLLHQVSMKEEFPFTTGTDLIGVFQEHGMVILWEMSLGTMSLLTKTETPQWLGFKAIHPTRVNYRPTVTQGQVGLPKGVPQQGKQPTINLVPELMLLMMGIKLSLGRGVME